MTTNQTIDGVPREQMISFPRELSEELGELIAEKARVCGGGAFDIWEAICDRFGMPDPMWNPSPAQASLGALLITLAQSGVKVSGGPGDEQWSIDPAAQHQGEPFRWFYAGVAYTHKPHSDAIALYAEQPAPVAVDVLNTGFYTTESGGGKYAISIGFRSMADMQAADAQLRDLLKSR